ncbi:MAG: glucose-6-phosphate isomerase [Erysipelotrichaceae bacterium]|nr:glucose-6-phosphate isomerase [Erysipelotrichaceae bacterium]
MVNIDLSYLLHDYHLEDYQDEINKIHHELMNKQGQGADFTGWVEWPAHIDGHEIIRIKECAKRLRKISDVILVCGIGGSYLGAKCAIDMLKGPYYQDDVEIIFCGNTFSSIEITRLLKYLDGKEVSINCISKSGSTTETSLAFRIFRQYLEKRYGKKESVERIVVTTDAQRGLLKPMCDKYGYESFVIPDDIGGRFSIITPVGLLPMACAGIDIDEFIKGLSSAYKHYQNPDLKENNAYKYALLRYLLNQKYSVEMFVSYEPSIKMFGEWLKQLFGESEGKENKGLLPDSVINSTDLHSLGQFVQEGSKILFETIINVEKPMEDMNFPTDEDDIDKMNYLAGKSLDWVNKQAQLGTIKAHTESGKVPNIIISIDEVNEYNFGELIYFFFMAVAMSGYLLKVNPFNQPGVEIYKQNMFKLLGK